jgi:hypothetical protein
MRRGLFLPGNRSSPECAAPRCGRSGVAARFPLWKRRSGAASGSPRLRSSVGPAALPFCRACANPARTRSLRISRSNSSKIASSPAIARPAGVVRSSPFSQWHEANAEMLQFLQRGCRSVTDRPQGSRRQTNTTSIPRRRAASMSCSRACRRARAGADLTNLKCCSPAAPVHILTQGAKLHRERLLIAGGDARV